MKIAPPANFANPAADASTQDQAPSARMAAAGVPNRGSTSASFLKKRLSLAMAKKTRGAVSMTLLVELKVEIRIIAATSLPAQGPRTARAAVAAIASLAAACDGPSDAIAATTAKRYRPIKIKEPNRKVRGKHRCGSSTSPAL